MSSTNDRRRHHTADAMEYSATGTSADDYAELCVIPVIGFRTKELVITAATNNIKYKVYGSTNGASWQKTTVISETTVTAGSNSITELTDAWGYYQVLHKSAAGGSAGTTTVDLSANRG